MTKPPAPQIGKPLLLPPPTSFMPATTIAFTNPGCVPPGSECNHWLIEKVQAEIDLFAAAGLAFQIASPKKQNLELTIELATGEYESVVFITKTQTVPVQAGNTLVGLDVEAAKAAQPYFVSGNTVTLAVQPKGTGVTVKVGKKD